MYTVRGGFDGIPTVRFGAVSTIGTLTVTCGAVFRYLKSDGAVRCYISYGAVRCGFQK